VNDAEGVSQSEGEQHQAIGGHNSSEGVHNPANGLLDRYNDLQSFVGPATNRMDLELVIDRMHQIVPLNRREDVVMIADGNENDQMMEEEEKAEDTPVASRMHIERMMICLRF
jgi:hypothetical protein